MASDYLQSLYADACVICDRAFFHNNTAIHTFDRIEVLLKGVTDAMKKTLLIITAIFLLTSCAAVEIQSAAKYEFDRGLSLFMRGQYEEAIPHLERATEIEPNFSKAYLYLGRSYLNLARWFEALSPLRTAFTLSPDLAKEEVVLLLVDALYGAAVREFKEGNFQSAIGFLRDVLDLQPQSKKAKSELMSAFISLGGKLLSEGKAAEAIDTFAEALKLSQNNAQAYLGLARAWFRQGDFVSALEAVKDAIKIDPKNREAQSLFRELMKQ